LTKWFGRNVGSSMADGVLMGEVDEDTRKLSSSEMLASFGIRIFVELWSGGENVRSEDRIAIRYSKIQCFTPISFGFVRCE